MEIQPLHKKHYPAVARIYQAGMDTGLATFETVVPKWELWDSKFLKSCRFVLIEDNQIAGWCALAAVSNRAVYKGVAEDTIYVAPQFQGKGIGRALLNYLVRESEKEGFYTLQAGIFSENKASIILHQQCGFRILGIREKIAKRDDKWHDNILMERRSQIF